MRRRSARLLRATRRELLRYAMSSDGGGALIAAAGNSSSGDDEFDLAPKRPTATATATMLASVEDVGEAGVVAQREAAHCFGCLTAYLVDCLLPLQQLCFSARAPRGARRSCRRAR